VLRKFLSALILLPLAIVLIALAVANRQNVLVSLDPFSANAPAASLTVPLFALIIVTLIVGVIVGGVAAWLGQGKWRRAARRLEREAIALRAKVDLLEAATAEPSIVPRQQDAPQRLKLKPPVR
jgi:uncharacterized membrane protein YciS (DUF1049 family)